MKNKSLFIYFLTIISVVLNLIMIKVLLNPNKFNILVKLGIFKTYNEQTLTNLVMCILVFSIITCILLLISFVLLIKKLRTPKRIKF